jgi:hypothetical protein
VPYLLVCLYICPPSLGNNSKKRSRGNGELSKASFSMHSELLVTYRGYSKPPAGNILFVLGPLACFTSELIWNYGSCKQLVGPLGRGISPSQGRYLCTEQQKHRINADKSSMARVRFEHRIPVFEWAKCILFLRPRGYCDRQRTV